MKIKRNRAVKRAAAIVGSQTALAKEIGATQSQVGDWIRGRVRVPILRAYEISALVDNVVTAEEIAPWFFKEIRQAQKKRKSKSSDTCVS